MVASRRNYLRFRLLGSLYRYDRYYILAGDRRESISLELITFYTVSESSGYPRFPPVTFFSSLRVYSLDLSVFSLPSIFLPPSCSLATTLMLPTSIGDDYHSPSSVLLMYFNNKKTRWSTRNELCTTPYIFLFSEFFFTFFIFYIGNFIFYSQRHVRRVPIYLSKLNIKLIIF